MNEWMDGWIELSNELAPHSTTTYDDLRLATFGIVGDVGDDERVGEARRDDFRGGL